MEKADVIESHTQRLQGICVENWGLIPYAETESKQRLYIDEIASGFRKSTVVVCEHPPVVSVGRATQAGDVYGWTGETYEVSRGGRATYHGPEQIVIYPLIDLKPFGCDIRKHLKILEACVVESLREVDIVTETKEGETGIWAGDKKVCSFGVACRHWVTYHGLALYLYPSATAYKGIHPCGYSAETMISVNELAGRKIDKEILTQSLVRKIISSYQY